MAPDFEVDLQNIFNRPGPGETVSYAQARNGLNPSVRKRIGEYRLIDNGVIASIFDADVLERYTVRTIRRKSISFSFIKEGSYLLQFPQHAYATKPLTAHMTIARDSLAQHRPNSGTHRVAGVIVFLELERLISLFGLDLRKFPAELRQSIRNNREIDAEFSGEIPLAPSCWMIVDQILSCRFTDTLRSKFLKAKIIELLCEVIAYFNQLDRPPVRLRISATQREQTCIRTAALIYRHEMRRPLSLDAMARRVGLNRNKLIIGFRELFGLTPSEYSRRIRLEWAHKQISKGAMTVTEACQAVGYWSHSSFTRAYRGAFGYSPSETPNIASD